MARPPARLRCRKHHLCRVPACVGRARRMPSCQIQRCELVLVSYSMLQFVLSCSGLPDPLELKRSRCPAQYEASCSQLTRPQQERHLLGGLYGAFTIMYDDFSLLKENLSQMNPENCKFGIKVGELWSYLKSNSRRWRSPHTGTRTYMKIWVAFCFFLDKQTAACRMRAVLVTRTTSSRLSRNRA